MSWGWHSQARIEQEMNGNKVVKTFAMKGETWRTRGSQDDAEEKKEKRGGVSRERM